MPDEPRRCKPSISSAVCIYVERFRWVFAFWNGAILVFLQINAEVFILLYAKHAALAVLILFLLFRLRNDVKGDL